MTPKTPNATAAESAIRQVGKEFRRLRDLRGERIEDIAAYLDIKATYLFGIEQGDLSVIPSRRQAKSMLRRYADYLGLDGRTIVGPMDPILTSLEGDIAPQGAQNASRFDRTSVIILSASVVLGVLFGWSRIGEVNQFDLIPPPVTADVVSSDRASGDITDDGNEANDVIGLGGSDEPVINAEEGEPSEEVAQAADALLAELKTAIADNAAETSQTSATNDDVADQAVSRNAPRREERPANVLAALVAERGDGAYIYEAHNTDARVIVRALNDVLVQVTSHSRDYVWTQTMKAREMLLVPNRDDLELWTGDAGSIEVLVDGVILPPLGPPSTAISGLSLAVTSLEAISEVASKNGAKPTF